MAEAVRGEDSEVREMLPDGAKILERKINMTSGHPRYRGVREEEE